MADIIQSYGLFWKADDVFWGGGNRRGALLGVPTGGRLSDPTDFREQVGIYVLYHGHDLVYVGQTGGKEKQRLFRRLRMHRRDKLAGRWDTFSWFGLCRALVNGKLSKPTSRTRPTLPSAIDHMEAILIAASEPHLNRQGGRFGKGKRYLQVRDPHLGPSDQEMIREVWKAIRKGPQS